MSHLKVRMQKVHEDFQLNGIAYQEEELDEVGYSLVKEGLPHEIPIGDFILDWFSNSETITVRTSGSTGKPKTITLSKLAMVHSAKATAEQFQLSAKNTALLCLPMTGIAGKMMLVRAMVLGLHLDYIVPDSNPLAATNASYDFVAMVPLQAKNSFEELRRVNTLILGGAPVNHMLEKDLSTLPVEAFETYGMTETITHIALRSLNGQTEKVFQTLPQVRVSADARGCLVINAPRISSEPIITNDLVELISENQFKWLGRIDSVINSGGVKIIPEKVESTLANHLTQRFFIAGVPDAMLGQKVVLVIEGTELTEKQTESLKNNFQKLEKFERPKDIISIPKFTETPTGKIQRSGTLASVK
ncbi:MAG: AMP-binding protein [Bacteroidota bacterium]